MKRSAVASLLSLLPAAAVSLRVAEPEVMVVRWFDTEDYLLPASDDAAKREAERAQGGAAYVAPESVAGAYGRWAMGVRLTGTGGDGAAGLRRLRLAGGVTLAQEEATSGIARFIRAVVCHRDTR